MSSGQFFTATEDGFIRANYRSMSIGALARELNRSYDGVNKRIRTLGIRRRPLRRWSAEADKALWDAAGVPLGIIAQQLSRSPGSLSERWKRIGDGTTWRGRLGYKQHKGRAVASYPKVDGHTVRMFEHRAVGSAMAGRPLKSHEIVHHIDLDIGNNGIDNLHICPSRSAHRVAHFSVERLVPQLLELGVIYFDRTEGIYKLCEIRK